MLALRVQLAQLESPDLLVLPALSVYQVQREWSASRARLVSLELTAPLVLPVLLASVVPLE
jgi:hypothetical protein